MYMYTLICTVILYPWSGPLILYPLICITDTLIVYPLICISDTDKCMLDVGVHCTSDKCSPVKWTLENCTPTVINTANLIHEYTVGTVNEHLVRHMHLRLPTTHLHLELEIIAKYLVSFKRWWWCCLNINHERGRRFWVWFRKLFGLLWGVSNCRAGAEGPTREDHLWAVQETATRKCMELSVSMNVHIC